MTHTVDARAFCIREGTKVDLEKWPTHVNHAYKSPNKYRKLLDKQVDELSSLQPMKELHR